MAIAPMDAVESCRAFLSGQISHDAVCRAVVRHPTWHLLVNDQSCPLFQEIGGRNWVVAMTEHRPVDGVNAHATLLSGRELVRILGDADGIAFEPGTDHAVAFSREEIDNHLLHYAAAIDCEAALQNPEQSAAQQFGTHTWLLLMDGDQPFIDESSGHALTYAFTAPDAAEAWRRERPSLDGLTVKRMRGTDMFARIAEMARVDGLQVNPEFQTFPPLSPFVVNALANGVDRRLDARVLPAHSIAEIHTFLDQMQVYRMTIEHEMVYRDDVLVARYRGVAAGGRRVSFDFTPVEPTDDPLHIGVHRSEILCPGWLASRVIDVSQVLPDEPSDLSDNDVRLLQHAMRWIAQVWTLLDGRPVMLQAELLTVEGAAAVRKCPEIVSQAFIARAFSRLAYLERKRGVPTP